MPHTSSDVDPTFADKERWVTRDVIGILLAQTVFGFGWSLYLLTPKFLATELHAGPETIGHVAAMGGFAGLLTVPFAARGLDRLGRRLFFQLGSALVVLLSLGFLQVHAIGPLVFLLQGCLSASFVLAYNAAAALLTDYAPPRALGKAIGWLGSANVAMNAISTAVAEPLAARFGWQLVFQLGVLAGLCAFAMSFFLRAPKSARSTQPTAAEPVQIKPLVGPLVAGVLIGMVFVAGFSFLQPYAVSLGAREVRGFFLGFTLAAVTCRLFLGGLGDRLGRRRVAAWMMVAYALATVVMRGLQPELLFVYGFAFGAAHGLLYPTLNALVLEVLPSSRKGLGMVLFNGSFNLGSSTGGLVWGVLAARAGYPSMYTGAALLALVAVLALRVSSPLPAAARR
jgi:MFS family permease